MAHCRPLLLALLMAFPALIPTPLTAEAFHKNQTRLSLQGGTAAAFDKTYFVVGGGGGYFPVNGLELGLDGEAWLGSRPHIYKLSPQIRYILYRGAIKPYIGALYRHSWFEGLNNLSSVGGRAGIYTTMNKNLHSGVGVVVEKYLNCDEKTYQDCSSLSPEVNISLSF
jgi:hypothetical protein